MVESQVAEFIAKFGLVGAVVLALLFYRKPLLDMLGRATRDPLVESLGAQNTHFADNNRMMHAMGPSLIGIDNTLKSILREQESQTRLLNSIWMVETAVKDEIIRGGGRR